MSTPKQYVIRYTASTGKKLFFFGTTDELIDKFKNTLEQGVGTIYNTDYIYVNPYPTTISSLVSNLNRSVKNRTGSKKICKNYDYREIGEIK